MHNTNGIVLKWLEWSNHLQPEPVWCSALESGHTRLKKRVSDVAADWRGEQLVCSLITGGQHGRSLYIQLWNWLLLPQNASEWFLSGLPADARKCFLKNVGCSTWQRIIVIMNYTDYSHFPHVAAASFHHRLLITAMIRHIITAWSLWSQQKIANRSMTTTEENYCCPWWLRLNHCNHSSPWLPHWQPLFKLEAASVGLPPSVKSSACGVYSRLEIQLLQHHVEAYRAHIENVENDWKRYRDFRDHWRWNGAENCDKAESYSGSLQTYQSHDICCGITTTIPVYHHHLLD